MGPRGMSAGRRAFLILTVTLCAAGTLASTSPEVSPTPDPGRDASSTLIYVSDYFSFVGRDAQGSVAFALDNNRGRDGNDYQAEHFVVLHDERRGWVNLFGSGRYGNPKRELRTIPDSPSFQFHGTADTGFTATSAANKLTLRVAPIPTVLSRQHEGAKYRMGGAPATLEWAGRILEGRVVYEYVWLPYFNRLTRTYWGLWKEYQGLYLALGGAGDLYVHSQQSEMIAPLTGKLAGFLTLGDQAEELQGLALTPLAKTMALGFYRWPTQWRLDWRGRDGPVSTTLTLSDLKTFANWVIGGFAMGIVTGEVTINGQRHEVYGLAELLI